jgi:hypothetical protein
LKSKFADSVLGGDIVGCALDYLTAIDLAYSLQYPNSDGKLSLVKMGEKLDLEKLYKSGIRIVSIVDGELDDYGAVKGLDQFSNSGWYQNVLQISTGLGHPTVRYFVFNFIRRG